MITWDGRSPVLALRATVCLAWRLEELGPDIEDPDGFLSDREYYKRGWRWCECYSRGSPMATAATCRPRTSCRCSRRSSTWRGRRCAGARRSSSARYGPYSAGLSGAWTEIKVRGRSSDRGFAPAGVARLPCRRRVSVGAPPQGALGRASRAQRGRTPAGRAPAVARQRRKAGWPPTRGSSSCRSIRGMRRRERVRVRAAPQAAALTHRRGYRLRARGRRQRTLRSWRLRPKSWIARFIAGRAPRARAAPTPRRRRTREPAPG